MIDSALLETLGQLGIFGVLVYILVVIIPKKEEATRDSIQKIHEQHERELDKQNALRESAQGVLRNLVSNQQSTAQALRDVKDGISELRTEIRSSCRWNGQDRRNPQKSPPHD